MYTKKQAHLLGIIEQIFKDHKVFKDHKAYKEFRVVVEVAEFRLMVGQHLLVLGHLAQQMRQLIQWLQLVILEMIYLSVVELS
jgi:hypothetical protein